MLFCFSYPRQHGYVGTIARIHIGLGVLRRPIAGVHLALDYVATSWSILQTLWGAEWLLLPGR